MHIAKWLLGAVLFSAIVSGTPTTATAQISGTAFRETARVGERVTTAAPANRLPDCTKCFAGIIEADTTGTYDIYYVHRFVYDHCTQLTVLDDGETCVACDLDNNLGLDGENCGDEWHWYNPEDYPVHVLDFHNAELALFDMSCYENAQDCIISLETARLFDQLKVAVTHHNAVAIDEILGREPSLVEYNETRAAIQIVGCGGSIVGHFPLDEDLEKSLRKITRARVRAAESHSGA